MDKWFKFHCLLFIFKCGKSGSHMPPSYLRHSCRCCLRHRSDMRTEVAGNRGHVSLNRRHACEVELAGMPVAKAAMFLIAGGVVSSYVGEVSQAVPAAMSQVLRRHMRTRLNVASDWHDIYGRKLHRTEPRSVPWVFPQFSFELTLQFFHVFRTENNLNKSCEALAERLFLEDSDMNCFRSRSM